MGDLLGDKISRNSGAGNTTEFTVTRSGNLLLRRVEIGSRHRTSCARPAVNPAHLTLAPIYLNMRRGFPRGFIRLIICIVFCLLLDLGRLRPSTRRPPPSWTARSRSSATKWSRSGASSTMNPQLAFRETDAAKVISYNLAKLGLDVQNGRRQDRRRRTSPGRPAGRDGRHPGRDGRRPHPGDWPTFRSNRSTRASCTPPATTSIPRSSSARPTS